MRESTRNLIRELREIASSGAPMTEAAQRLGIKYGTVASYARTFVIDFQRKKRSAPTPSTATRNREIADRFLAGEEQAALAREYGITRERVRQICNKQGCVTARKRQEDFMATVAGAAIRKGLTVQQTADMFGISRVSAYMYGKRYGFTFPTMTAEEAQELERLVILAATKTSIRQAAGCDHALSEKIRRELKKRGLETKGRSRHDDFSHRKDLIARWRGQGKTWDECAALLTSHDGKKIGTNGVYGWAYRHMPELFDTPELSRTAA